MTDFTPTTSVVRQLQDTALQRQLVAGILVFDNVEVLDFCGPFEVLSVCRMGTSDDENENITQSPFQVKLIGISKDPVSTVGGMQVLPHLTMKEVMASSSPLDILIIPGGMGTRPLRNNKAVLEFVTHQASVVKIMASVCTGAILLAKSGILPPGTTITTHWKAIDMLQEWYPSLNMDKEHSVIRNDAGTLYTSAGISAGIDMTFRLVKDVFGDDVARATAKRMEYGYPEDYRRRIQM
jgi:transcriptional regulator GlxA family with amidase domain